MGISLLFQIGQFSWILGMILLLLSRASSVTAKAWHERKDWRRYVPGDSIKGMLQAINSTNDIELKRKLKRKVIMRRMSYVLLLLFPVLMFVGSVFRIM